MPNLKHKWQRARRRLKIDSDPNYNYARYRFWFNMAGGVGLWGAGFVWLLFSSSPSLSRLTDSGQVVLFCMGFLAPSMAELIEDRDIKDFPHRASLGLTIFIVFLLAMLMFAGVTANGVEDNSDALRNPWVFRIVSVLLAIASLVLSFAVSYNSFSSLFKTPIDDTAAVALADAADREDWDGV